MRGEHRHSAIRSGGLRNTKPLGNTRGAVPCVLARSTVPIGGTARENMGKAMRAILAVLSVIMIVVVLCATYMALGDLMNPLKPDKIPSIIAWVIFFAPTVILVHFAWFRHKAKPGGRDET